MTGLPLLTCLLGSLIAQSGAAAPSSVTLENCYVTQIEEVQVPAQEAGVLKELAVKEGDMVQQGQPIGQIDDVEARMQQRVAAYELRVAKEKADSDVNIRYSKASADVAKAEYDQAVEANRRLPGTKPMAEVRRLELKWKESNLSIEQAQMNQRIAGLESQVAQARLEAAGVGIERRQITAPIDAVVLKLHHHQGEWVQPGDPVVHIIQLNRLWVEGFVDAEKVSPSEVDGKPVQVAVVLARGRQVTVPGRIVFAKPVIEGNTYLVRAEVENRQENGFWMLSPGMPARMTIQVR
jgi:multidrug efflux pump subunit AcrA (membrane-fusion protein)